MSPPSPQPNPRADRVLNGVGTVLVLICLVSGVVQLVHGQVSVLLGWLTDPIMLEAFIKTLVTGAAMIALYLILGRPARAEVRVQNDQRSRRR